MSPDLPPATEPAAPLVDPVYSKDAELVKACLAGDNEAWKTIISRYSQLIYSIPRRYRLDADDAADVYQAVCLALWKGLGTLRSEKALTNWVIVTTTRQSERLARRRRKEASRLEADGDDASEARVMRVAAPESDPLADVQDLQLKHRLKQAMDRLPQRCVDLLTRLYLVEEQPDYDTLSSELGIPRGSLGPTRGRCLEKLKKIYEKG